MTFTPRTAFELYQHAAQAYFQAFAHAQYTKDPRHAQHARVLHAIAVERFAAARAEHAIKRIVRETIRNEDKRRKRQRLAQIQEAAD